MTYLWTIVLLGVSLCSPLVSCSVTATWLNNDTSWGIVRLRIGAHSMRDSQRDWISLGHIPLWAMPAMPDRISPTGLIMAVGPRQWGEFVIHEQEIMVRVFIPYWDDLHVSRSNDTIGWAGFDFYYWISPETHASTVTHLNASTVYASHFTETAACNDRVLLALNLSAMNKNTQLIGTIPVAYSPLPHKTFYPMPIALNPTNVCPLPLCINSL